MGDQIRLLPRTGDPHALLLERLHQLRDVEWLPCLLQLCDRCSYNRMSPTLCGAVAACVRRVSRRTWSRRLTPSNGQKFLEKFNLSACHVPLAPQLGDLVLDLIPSQVGCCQSLRQEILGKSFA
jgi:hypothetical protein